MGHLQLLESRILPSQIAIQFRGENQIGLERSTRGVPTDGGEVFYGQGNHEFETTFSSTEGGTSYSGTARVVVTISGNTLEIQQSLQFSYTGPNGGSETYSHPELHVQGLSLFSVEIFLNESLGQTFDMDVSMGLDDSGLDDLRWSNHTNVYGPTSLTFFHDPVPPEVWGPYGDSVYLIEDRPSEYYYHDAPEADPELGSRGQARYISSGWLMPTTVHPEIPGGDAYHVAGLSFRGLLDLDIPMLSEPHAETDSWHGEGYLVSTATLRINPEPDNPIEFVTGEDGHVAPSPTRFCLVNRKVLLFRLLWQGGRDEHDAAIRVVRGPI